MLNYAVAFLVLVICIFVIRMSSVLTTYNLYLASIQGLLHEMRQDLQKQTGQEKISQGIERIREELTKIAAYEEENLPDCAATLSVILDRTVSSLVELQGMHSELKKATRDLGNIAQMRGR